MHFNSEENRNAIISSSQNLPEKFRGALLKGANIEFTSTPAGTILIQYAHHPTFDIRYQLFELNEKSKFNSVQDPGFLISILSLRNKIRGFIKGMGKFDLRPGQFILLHCLHKPGVLEFEKANTYETLEISWSEKIIDEALSHFPILDILKSNDSKSNYFLFGGNSRPAGSAALDIAHSILHSKYDKKLSALYFEHKVREYLIELLVQSDKQIILQGNLTNAERVRINELAEEMILHPEKKFPIRDIARELGMNEMKLKMGFKKEKGQGIFEFQLASRMKEAHRLLLETDLTTKAIAAKVGYQLTTSFITKFREFFGYPPSQVSKMRND
ncbi:MAG: hypothetical protein C5B52_07750 [Bacteroidetes bacterium]|nr:MAG: hypothetical protein C5B52_07750 [Bacteroidota bacterium]